MTARLRELAERYDVIGDVRGRGAMVAVELVRPGTLEPDAATAAAVAKACHADGLVVLTCGTYGNVLRFLPPLVMPDAPARRGPGDPRQGVRRPWPDRVGAADTVFVGGRAVRSTARRERGAVAVARRPHRARRHRRRGPRGRRRRHRGRRRRRRAAAAGRSRTPTCTRSLAGVDLLRCDLTRRERRPRRRSARIATYAGERTPTCRGSSASGWSMAHFPGGTPTREALDAVVRDRPATPEQPRRPRRLGQHAGRSSSPASTRRHPDPPDGRIERDADGAPHGTLHEGAGALVERLRAAADAGRAAGRPAGGAGGDVLLRHHGLAGRRGGRAVRAARLAAGLPARARQSAQLRARVVGGAVVGPRPRCRADRRAGRAPRTPRPRGASRPTTVKIMQDGVVENFTAGLLEPLPGRLRLPRPATAASASSTRSRCAST